MHPQLLLTISPPPGIEECGGDGEREDFAEKINLDLGIGSCLNKKKINQEKTESIFTDAQFHEFYQQILVYNFFSSLLPLPLNLFLPIWHKVLDSFGPAIFKKYPSLTGFGSWNSDCSSTMDDSEPGRCRRTDGRKWRCSKNVIPNQKYCERHMHRGRQGSRKRVEPIQSVSKPDNKTSTSDNTAMPTVSLVTSDLDNRISLSHTPNQPITDMDAGFENGNPRNISGRKHCVERNNNAGFVSPGFGLSPKSVLNRGSGKIDLSLGSKNDVIETEPQRCRRTDGKKWQCRRNSIPNQKYCEAHMHRGTKRLMLNPESFSNAPVTLASNQTGHISHTMAGNVDNGINLNTMPASPQHISGYNSSSSTSDATTITDENISISLTQSLHNC
ncbi:hypothetical protein BUALT_Bualt01G0214400 [Buddleja alternifolia]|uniref:Growth-regulating factor n=1 Tax=Buddleja alternifolia TaxID=168488 RepID=A0AAV6YFX1_9LAMI|nr:hypothetical protein BUALT_Bualt01G0214400 [Buddleja alternifolia]